MGMWVGPRGIEEGDRLDAAATAHVVRRTWDGLREQRGKLWVALAVTLLWTGTTLAQPAIFRHAIDHGISRHDGGVLDRDVVAGSQVGIGQVGADEAGAASDENAHDDVSSLVDTPSMLPRRAACPLGRSAREGS